MLINWFSPLPPLKSDIARYSCVVLAELQERCNVTVWTSQADIDSSSLSGLRVCRYDADNIPWGELNRADCTVFNLGNNPAFHGDIWHVARRHPGIVILHDLALHHFFDGMYRVHAQRLHYYVDVMRRHYGEVAAIAAEENFKAEGANNNELATKYPLTEHALENALGVLVHNADGAQQLRRSLGLPVAYAPLPFGPHSGVQTRRLAGEKSRRCRLIVFGHLSSNRRIDRVLHALCEMPERDLFALDIYGSNAGLGFDIEAECSRRGLSNVSFHGFVSEEELEGALDSADLAINLRYPTMGEASGSQLRIWAHALPSIVTPVGWYASLPTGSVLYARPGQAEVDDLQSHLRSYLINPEPFWKIGEIGRDELWARHSPKECAEAVLELASRSNSGLRRLFTSRLQRNVWSLLDHWLSPSQQD